ncbi:MAG: extracellular solute-binding protein [Candidatus Kaiserbacteria bacterium]|nr:extracellular solute-binding protein [Candidatus Kaiserbacteria bacterium]
MKLSLFQTILLGVFSVGALIGLFVFATFTGTSGSNAIGSVVIWGTLPSEGMQAALTAAAKIDATLKDVTYVQKDAATLPADIATAIATGSSPDLVLASQESLRGLTRFIEPVPLSTLPASDFTRTFIREGGIFTAPGGSGYYGVPFLVDPLVLFSNRSILSSSGIAKPPATWEALVGLVPNIAILTPSRQITRGLIALGTYDNVRNARGILSALFLQQGIPISSYSSSGVPVADLGQNASSDASKGSSVLGFYTQFADPSKVSYTWNTSLPDSEQMFLTGDLALYLGYASRARFLSSANPNLDFIVTPLPQSATARTKRAYGLLYAFMLPRGAKNAAGAYQVAVLLTGSAEQAAAATATGLAPASVNELAKAAPSDPVAAVAYPEALYAEGWLSPAPADADRVFSGMIGNVISGHSTLDTAIGDAARSLSSLLQQ